MATLCSTDELLIIATKPKRPPVTARYWERLEARDPRTKGHLAVGQLSLNAVKLGFNEDAVSALLPRNSTTTGSVMLAHSRLPAGSP